MVDLRYHIVVHEGKENVKYGLAKREKGVKSFVVFLIINVINKKVWLDL